MTLIYGIGMLVFGIVCICIGATITYFILNRKTPEEIENEEYLKELKKKL